MKLVMPPLGWGGDNYARGRARNDLQGGPPGDFAHNNYVADIYP